jgi:hypothetical protein
MKGGVTMRMRVYHIEVLHGDAINPCTCTEDDLDDLCDSLPEDKEVIEFIERTAHALCKAPVLVTSE